VTYYVNQCHQNECRQLGKIVPLSQLSSTLFTEQEKNSWQQFTSVHEVACDELSDKQLKDFKLAITLSDFILNSALQAPDLVIELFKEEYVYQQNLPDYKALLIISLENCSDETQLFRLLRRFRLQQMVNIAVADLIFNVDLELSLERLSSLADELIQASLQWLTKLCQNKWGIPKNSAGEVQALLVYGMGKLGGQELNFSSDIDLIFMYPEAGETQGCRRNLDNQQFFTRLGQKLISSLHQQTADGFVYRVDMRLRPFGDSGPLVLTFGAMEDYYQEQGRDWERYAMLKARLIGNSEYHEQLTTLLKPFVYRRYIDFSVIDSLRRMKMMISQEVRRKQLVNNIKLGAGGIREIEFIVQVFQLIRGGRIKSLQQRRLLTVLPELVNVGELDEESKNTLENAYRFLRRVENILQALADKQTQTLPDNELDQQRLLFVLKFKSWHDFLSILHNHMNAVHQTFEELIGVESPNHQAEDQHWAALWHSRWDDEESIAWIEQESKYWNSQKVWQLLSDFRHDIDKRTLGNRGRQILDKLVPLFICHVQGAKLTEVVLERVLIIFKKIATRTAYLELLFENEGALKQLINLCEASSWVTDYIAKYPILLDELIVPARLNNSPELTTYALELRENMLRVPEDDLEVQMESLRQFKQAQQLRIAAAEISGVLVVDKVSQHLTALAEAIIDEVINIAWQQVISRFGVPECANNSLKNGLLDKGFCIIAYGKMGGIELGYGSDLDLVFVHNSETSEVTTGIESKDGIVNKSVPVSQFYMKLAQRILHIFNTRMNSGILYELDMRLRPSGNSGVLVVHINTFAQYQKEDAWTWEHQALVRARMIYGNDALNKKFQDIKKVVLSTPRKLPQLKADVINMREKMRVHLDKSTNNMMDIKQGKGGLVDIEFLAQYLVLAYSHQFPHLSYYCDNLSVFKALAKIGVLDKEERNILISAYQKLRSEGHKATLQNEDLIIERNNTELNSAINKLWEKYLLN